MGIKPLEQKPLRGFSYVEGVGDGIAQCAASPWTYRTDTGDEHGKVVESAELPEFEWGKSYLIKTIVTGYSIASVDNASFRYINKRFFTYPDFNDFLRKHLIAYAEIRK